MGPRQRILFVDAYDSFSNNLISLLESELDVSVTKISIHTPFDVRWLASFSGVMIGPGPGNPYEKNDIGCIDDIWHLADEHLLPVIGICLGFQSLVVNFGGQVKQLPIPRHGINTPVTTGGDSIFRGLPELDVVQYHSLHGVLDADGMRSAQKLWSPSPSCPELVPLAWDIGHSFSLKSHHPEDSRSEKDRLNPHRILMGVSHASKPFYGVQFHPESICSNPHAHKVLTNWWTLAQEWNKRQGRTPRSDLDHLGPQASAMALEPLPRTPHGAARRQLPYSSEKLALGTISIPRICDLLNMHQSEKDESIILDSEMKRTANLSKHSIIGLVLQDSMKVSYSIGSNEVALHYPGGIVRESLQPYNSNIFKFLKALMARYQMPSADRTTPFFGGLMGFITYEACLETIQVPASPIKGRPDVMFAFVERSVVINHDSQSLLVQSIREGDDLWVQETASLLRASNLTTEDCAPLNGHATPFLPPSIQPPKEAHYCQKIRECQSQIRQGNAYELCLTDQTHIQYKRCAEASWARYRRLRQLNPATFGAYIRLGPLTLLSSSPERFMCWSRPDTLSADRASICQFRPIKGTVKKVNVHADGRREHIDLAAATAILSTPKERAENLMIVDLIRHDLAGVVGSGNVDVRSLMQVEEYEHVYQLVTVIEGSLKQPAAKHRAALPYRQLEDDHSPSSSACSSSSSSFLGVAEEDDATEQECMQGIDVLAASLPPGSMTGAPKKRSCELLRAIEGGPRSVYSGVLGYVDVGGGGDFSVVIRTAYRWDDEVGLDAEGGAEKEPAAAGGRDEVWRIGAGGAITDMSTEDGEWEEMYAKLDCALGLFQQA